MAREALASPARQTELENEWSFYLECEGAIAHSHCSHGNSHVVFGFTANDDRHVKQIRIEATHGHDGVSVVIGIGLIVAIGVELDVAKASGAKGCCKNGAELVVFFSAAAINGNAHSRCSVDEHGGLR